MNYSSKPTKRKVLSEVITLLIIVVLIYAAINKFINYRSFRLVLGITPSLKEMVSVLTWAIPLIELSIAILVMLQKTKIVGLYLSICLFFIYLLGMFQLKLYAPNIRGGLLDGLSFTQYVIVNTFLLTLSLAGILLYSVNKRPTKEATEPPTVVFT